MWLIKEYGNTDEHHNSNTVGENLGNSWKRFGQNIEAGLLQELVNKRRNRNYTVPTKYDLIT